MFYCPYDVSNSSFLSHFVAFNPVSIVDVCSAFVSINNCFSFFSQITKFCDVDGQDESSYHNREAPNKHNRLCSRRSNWEILKEHEDFKSESHVAI